MPVDAVLRATARPPVARHRLGASFAPGGYRVAVGLIPQPVTRRCPDMGPCEAGARQRPPSRAPSRLRQRGLVPFIAQAGQVVLDGLRDSAGAIDLVAGSVVVAEAVLLLGLLQRAAEGVHRVEGFAEVVVLGHNVSFR